MDRDHLLLGSAVTVHTGSGMEVLENKETAIIPMCRPDLMPSFVPLFQHGSKPTGRKFPAGS
jgi:hypothetical protein